MSPRKGNPLACEEIVVRGVEPDQLRERLGNLTVRKSAFLPRKNGKDNSGLSVTKLRSETLGHIRNQLNAPTKEAVTLHVGSVRQIQAGDLSLDVRADPLPQDHGHALIIGFPERAADEPTDVLATCNRLAELLAQHSRCCLKE